MTKNNFNQWDEKFLREYPFMAFGSLLNAYAQMHQQHPKDLKEFQKDARKLFRLAQSLAQKSLKDTQPKTSKEELKKAIEAEEAIKETEEFQKRYNKDSELEEINQELQQAEEKLNP